jgi:hypothetical protein
VEDLAAQYEDVDYVPVFESVVNSRVEIAWERDRIHVADLAVRANVLHFLANYLADPAKSSQAASALRKRIGGNRLAGQRNFKTPLPDFEFAAADANAFSAGLPQITVSSEMALNYGAQFLGSGPAVPWHAESPVSYPQTVTIAFRVPLKPKALWLQAQDHHFDRAPRKFSLYGCNGDNERRLLLQSRSKPSWDFTGWASWRLRDTEAYARYEIVIQENCGNPELLTLQRLWFEPDPSSGKSTILTLPAAASSGRRTPGPDIVSGSADDPEKQRQAEYAGDGD